MAIVVLALVSGILSLGPSSVLPTRWSWLSQSFKQLSPVLFCFCSTIQISVGLYLPFSYWVRIWSSNLWVLMEPKPHPRKPSHTAWERCESCVRNITVMHKIFVSGNSEGESLGPCEVMIPENHGCHLLCSLTVRVQSIGGTGFSKPWQFSHNCMGSMTCCGHSAHRMLELNMYVHGDLKFP